MAAKISFFPVGNGDMTLMVLESGRKVLVDMNIRAAADDPDDDTPDVGKELRDRLSRDGEDRLYVDALLVSHPDKDHCSGLINHFHLGRLEDWSEDDDKIVIREVWSSPMVFRRASKNHTLCADARAFNAEARRRVAKYRETGGAVEEGDRILILGEDENGKTDDLQGILVKVDQEFNRINGVYDATMRARLLAPHPKGDDDEEELRSKNQSSTIINFSITGGGMADACRFLTGGDAEVLIWERLWERHKNRKDWLSYNILQTPHHCSWHSLSYDSWSEFGEDAEVCDAARNALAQGREGALIIASSNPIKDDDVDPPCIRAKREYVAIAKECDGEFKCVGEMPSEKKPEVFDVEITREGPKPKGKKLQTITMIGSGAVGGDPIGHG